MVLGCIKEGFRLTHRNWQLILIHVVVAVINILSLFLFLGVPIFVAMTYLGIDIAHAKDVLPHLFRDPLEFVTRYMGLIFFIITAMIFYLIFVSLIYLYTLGGTLGVLRNSAMDKGHGFKLSSFFSEAKRHFTRLFWLLSVLILAITALFVVFATFSGIAAIVLQGIDIKNTSVQMFFNSFLSLFIIVFGLIILYFAVVFVVYSVVISVIEEKGIMESMKRTFNFLMDNTIAFLYYFLLLIGITAANLVLVTLSVIPVFAPLINLFLQNYLSVVLWSSLIVFYVNCTHSPAKPIVPESSLEASST